MSGWLRTIVGRVKGYGGCHRCGHTWNWKKGHLIPYMTHGTLFRVDVRNPCKVTPYHFAHMFPLCEECYQECSPQERFDYCQELYHSWNRPEKEVEWDTIAEYVGLHSYTETVRGGASLPAESAVEDASSSPSHPLSRKVKT